MSTAAMTLGLRPRLRLGPALRRVHVPYGPLALSAVAHAVGVGALIATALLWPAHPTKTYVVNLVPAIAAVGSPQGRAAPDLPPRVAPPSPVDTSTSRELPPPSRESRPDLPPPAPDLPSLPDRALPPRASATLPRPGDKELPPVARATSPRPAPTTAPTTTAPAPPPAAPVGQAAGSPQGAGAVTLNVSDFPYAWYIQAIHRKIQERWEGKGLPGHQPEIIFEITKGGQLGRLSVGKGSGNPAYDQMALRAVADANPFPPLPEGFDKPVLTIGLQFVYDPRTR